MQLKKINIFIFSLFVLVSLNNSTFAADYTFANQTLSLSNTTGCALSTYTFSQKTTNQNNAKINAGVTVTIVFPALVNITTATMAGSSFSGIAIAAGWTIAGQTLTFTAPTNVGKNKTFSIVIANITNGNATNANATISIPNNSAGVNTGLTYLVTTTVCPPIPANNNCTGAISVTPAVSGSGTCTATNGTTFGATASTQATCSGIADDDVWYSFVANNASHQVIVDGVANFNAIVQVFSGACPSGFTSLSCTDITGNDGIETVSFSGLTNGTTYFVRVYHSGLGPGVSAANSFTICVTSSAAVCNIGAGNLTAPSLPYVSGAQTTCLAGNDITSANVTNICGSNLYYGGLDKVVQFTPASSGSVNINTTSSGSWLGMMLYQGCPTTGGVCIANAQSSAGNQSMGCVPVVNGLTYYLIVDSYPAPNCNPFNVTISAPSVAALTGTVCSNAVAMSFPFSALNQSTLCFGNDYTNASIGSPASLYESGEDKVYSFTTTGARCFNLILSNTSTSNVGFQVYSGCPGVVGTVCLANGGGATGGNLASSFTVPAAGTYYLVIDTWSAPSSVNYDLLLTTSVSGPTNDLPCNAESLILDVSVGGENNCSGSASEPGVPVCWSGGTINSVWYTIVVPASGKVKIRTTQGSLINTQIAVYTGTCGALTYLACNDNSASCSSFSTFNSELSLIGLTVGNTIFVRIDGNLQSTGTFSILAIDGNNSFPAIPGQDCGDPNPVCAVVMAISNPGYSGFGNTCDLPTSYCLASGERNVVWYRIPIATAGTFDFNIVPNDFSFVTEGGTDYDFAIWKIAEIGGTLGTDFFNCAQIAAGTAPPDACNYSFLPVTGVGTNGNPPSLLPTTVCPTCPPAYNPTTTFASAYEPTLTAAAGDVYLLAISNFTSSNSGFRINFPVIGGSATIDFAASLTVAGGVTWSGGDISLPTDWADVDNWGGCATPVCLRDAFVAPFVNQPILLSGQTYNTKDLIIQAGASLTLQANSTLQICGNFTNFGTINADPTSTIVMNGAGVQAISGNFTATNRLGNITITKTAGNVVLYNDLDLGGSFATSSLTSLFNSNGKQLTIARNFTNFNGNTTFSNTGITGKLEFNGSTLQNYNQGLTQLDLNEVIVSNTAGLGNGLTLLSNMFLKSSTGLLTLNQGTVTTGSFAVNVLNTSVNAVSVGSAISFVDGNLTRSLASTGSYNWPIGNVAKGYQRANTNFMTSAMTSMTARFDIWPSSPPVFGGNGCSSVFGFAAQNNGYWTLTANAGTSTNYNLTLYPTNVTNTAGTTNWTIMKKPSLASGSWSLDGACAVSTVSVVQRTAMSGFSIFGIAQSITPLPIELLSFTGRSEGAINYLEWTTATEIDNDYFNLERSADGLTFDSFAEVDGAGNSESNIHYDKYDYNPFVGVTYYRLKQTDFNGVFTYSNIIALINVLDKVSMGGIHPNPTDDIVSFEFFSPKNGALQIRLIDNSGRIILDNLENITQDQTKISFSINNLAKGEYTLEVIFEKGDFSSKSKVFKN